MDSGNASRSILVVDDDPVFTFLTSETLRQAGFVTQVVDGAEAALACFESFKPDLVLLDVELPGRNGFELCSTLRASDRGLDVPIVMVTGHDDTESIARAFQAGATDFINKPVLWQTLPQRLEFILRAQDNMRALRISEQKNRALLQALPDTIYIVGADGVLVEQITGDEQPRTPSFVGKTLDFVFPEEVVRGARQCMADNGEEKPTTTYEYDVGRGAEHRFFETRLRPQPDGTLLIVTRDTTERHRAEARIKYLAYYDTLTGLPNRQLFMREVSRAIRVAQRTKTLVALLYLDLDRFKRINDNLGHSVGDALLKNVARRLQDSTRPSDTVSRTAEGGFERGRVARLGGDEFVVLLTDLRDPMQTTIVADRIRAALGEAFDCGGHRCVVTPSIGIAIYPTDGTDIEDLLVKADMAMYQAKDQGRNRHSFYGESMAIRSLGRLELENDLRRAFDAGDFQVYYQPKMDLASGEVVGVEALLRWHHATRGWISPDSFIPVAEETGIIVALGAWVIRMACQQLQRWKDTELAHLTIAVNVSVQQFAREDFVESVLRTLMESRIAPQRLELEITESLLLRNVEDTTAALNKFRAAGLRLSIDDFGTGYSSLAYLRRFPVDALKIDRSFVTNLHASSDAAAICAAIIAMARELKLQVIAEGVENAQELDFLRRLGCDQVQGFLLSRPVPAPELEALLDRMAEKRHNLHEPDQRVGEVVS